MSPVGDYDELLGLRYTATDLVLEFGIFLWACGTLCNGDLMYKNSCYGGSWDFIRNTCSREGLGLSASGWVSSPHQVPGGWEESTRGNWCSGTDLLKGLNPFPLSVPALTKPQTRAQWEKWTVSNQPLQTPAISWLFPKLFILTFLKSTVKVKKIMHCTSICSLSGKFS